MIGLDSKEILIILVGAVLFVWGLITLNNFIGGSDIFMYIGSPMALGVVVIAGGYFFSIYVQSVMDKDLS